MLLLIDNYDSFTYNLYQYLSELGAEVRVVRNDAVTLEEIERMAPSESSSRQAHARPTRPVSPLRSSGGLVPPSPSWACVLAISASASPTAPRSRAQAKSSTARPALSSTTAEAFSLG